MSEQDIDRVLEALGRMEAPRGLEQRVLARLEQTEVAPRGWWLGMRGWAVAGGLAVAALAVGLGIAGRHRAPVAPALTIVDRMRPVSPVAVASVPPVAERRVQVRRVTFVRAEVTDAGGGGEDAVAMAEMNAPSHPAPPMALTAGEKMLVRASRKPESVELARLEARAPAVRRDEEREFQAYFVHPAFLVTPTMTNNP
jgi:hypothetical protein